MIKLWSLNTKVYENTTQYFLKSWLANVQMNTSEYDIRMKSKTKTIQTMINEHII